jgi:hypothetical protein
MSRFKNRARGYRERAEELFAKAGDFQDPANRKTIEVLAEEYLAMADRLERFMDGTAHPKAREK